MNSPSDDDMFSRYRAELVMDTEARARTFSKLQERVLRGERPVPEIDVLPPQTAALRGLWSSHLATKWLLTIAGLGMGALLLANVVQRGAPLTAATSERVMVAQSTAAEGDGAAAVHETRSGRLGDAETGAVARAENAGAEGAPRTHAKSAARITSARSSTEPARRAVNAAPMPQPTAAARVREAGSPSSEVMRARESVASEAGQPPTAALGAQPGGAALAIDPASELVEGAQPSAAAANAKQQPQAYASPKEKEALPQRSDKELASETLTKEVQLLQAAQLALRAGDTQRSLALLAEHTWTYPQGHLAEARDVARILALCQAGNIAQSKLHAKRFLQQRPESPYGLRVRAGCEAMTNPTDPRRELAR